MSTLQGQLRALYLQYGDQLLADADGLRAVLDDYLDDGVATPGEVNMVVEAVRFGVAARLQSLLDAQADPRAAVNEVADVLARERGGGVGSARWSVAVVGYAVDRLPADIVAGYDSTGQPVAPTATEPEQQNQTPRPSAATADVVPTRVVSSPSQPAATQTPVTTPPVTLPDGPEPETPGPRRPGRAIVAAVVVLLVVAVGATAVWYALRDDSGDDAAADQDTGGSAPELPQSTPLGTDELVWSVVQNGKWDLVRGKVEDTVEPIAANPSVDEINPALSPDRASVIYVVADARDGSRSLWVAAVDGSGARPLWDGSDLPCSKPGGIAWSPDGGELALTCQDANGVPLPGLLIVSITDGGLLRTLAPQDQVNDSAITWSESGEIVFVRSNGNDPAEESVVGGDLYMVSAEGGAPRQLTSSPTIDAQPSWSPDSRWLLFQRYVKATGLDIFLLDVEAGSQPRRVAASTPQNDYDPAWSPGGTEFAFSTSTIYVVPLADTASAIAFGEETNNFKLAWSRQ